MKITCYRGTVYWKYLPLVAAAVFLVGCSKTDSAQDAANELAQIELKLKNVESISAKLRMSMSSPQAVSALQSESVDVFVKDPDHVRMVSNTSSLYACEGTSYQAISAQKTYEETANPLVAKSVYTVLFGFPKYEKLPLKLVKLSASYGSFEGKKVLIKKREFSLMGSKMDIDVYFDRAAESPAGYLMRMKSGDKELFSMKVVYENLNLNPKFKGDNSEFKPPKDYKLVRSPFEPAEIKGALPATRFETLNQGKIDSKSILSKNKGLLLVFWSDG